MATIAVRPPVKRRTDDAFFVAMSVVILATVLFGFARTYFLAGMVFAPLPSRLAHVHGAVFTSWVALFIAQILLVASRNVRLHMKLGWAGVVLAGLMIVVGIAATLAKLHRGETPPMFTPPMFLVLNCWGITLFGLMVAWAAYKRKNPAAHKRIMLLATIGIMPPAISRWPIALIQQHDPMVGVVLLLLCLTVVVFDIVTRKRPHYATVVSSILVLSVQPLAVALGKTAFMHQIAARVMQP